MIESHSSIAEKFIKKGFWLIFLSFVIGPIGYVIKIIISHELSVEEVGILYGIISLIIILIGYNDFGITESLKYFIPKYYEEKRFDKIKSLLFIGGSMQVFSSLILMALFFFGADFLGTHYFHTQKAVESIKIFSLFFLGINAFQLINTFFLAIQNTFLYRFSELVRLSVVLLWTLSIFLLEKGSLLNYTYSWVLGLYFGVIFTFVIFFKKYYLIYFKKEKIILEKKFVKEIFGYAVLILIGSQASTILSQIDMQMIIYFLGTKDAGYYTNYLSLIGIFFIVIGPIFTFLLPVFSELSAKKNLSQLKGLKQELTHIFLIFGICYSMFVFCYSQNIAYVLFGEKFLFSGIILQYSVLFIVANFLLQINFNLLAALGKVKERIKIISGAIVLNIILNAFLIYTIGVVGAALATGFGWLYIVFRSEKTLGEEYKVILNHKIILKNLAIFLSLGVISFILGLQNLYTTLGRFGVLGAMFFLFIIWTFVYFLINKSFILHIRKYITQIRYAQK